MVTMYASDAVLKESVEKEPTMSKQNGQ